MTSLSEKEAPTTDQQLSAYEPNPYRIAAAYLKGYAENAKSPSLQEAIVILESRAERQAPQEQDDTCGFCGEPGADKIPHPVRWPGEQSAGTELVHAECESDECGRAHAVLSDRQRQQFLRSV